MDPPVFWSLAQLIRTPRVRQLPRQGIVVEPDGAGTYRVVRVRPGKAGEGSEVRETMAVGVTEQEAERVARE